MCILQNRFHMLLPVLLMVLLGIAKAANGELEARQQNNIPYISGGLGAGERELIEEMGSNYSFKVTFATHSGNYLGGGKISIRSEVGDILLEVETDGPVFFANLDPGNYTVVAHPGKSADRQVERRVTVGDRQTVLRLTWEG